MNKDQKITLHFGKPEWVVIAKKEMRIANSEIAIAKDSSDGASVFGADAPDESYCDDQESLEGKPATA